MVLLSFVSFFFNKGKQSLRKRKKILSVDICRKICRKKFVSLSPNILISASINRKSLICSLNPVSDDLYTYPDVGLTMLFGYELLKKM